MEKELNEQEQHQPQSPAEETDKPVYVPRPKRQVIAAWIGLLLFLMVVAAFYINVARGGL